MLTCSTLIIFIFSLIYLYFKRNYSRWQRKGLPFLTPSFPFGNFSNPFKKIAPAVEFKKFYDEFKRRGCKHGGVYLFSEPVYVPIDPDYVKNVIIKDFHHFVDRGIYHNGKDQPIMENLFFMEGTKWKTLRNKLTPTFTSGKMKMMFETMLKCSAPLSDEINALSVGGKIVDVKEVLARFTTDVIGSCAFGIDCNSFENSDSEFRKYGKKIFHPSALKLVKGIFLFAFPNIAKKLHFISVDKDIDVFFSKVVTDTYQYRKMMNVTKNDFMQLLIELKDKERSTDEKILTMDELIAQAFIFFVAGFDTSSAAMVFCLYELAKNLNLQAKLRDDIRSTLGKNDGKITYDVVIGMKYLHQVVEETMRKYPPVPVLNRVCTENYKIPETDNSTNVRT